MTGGDRRPWVILSAAEAEALVGAALAVCPDHAHPQRVVRLLPPALARAIRMVEIQMRWIEGAADGERPEARDAVARGDPLENAP